MRKYLALLFVLMLVVDDRPLRVLEEGRGASASSGR